MQHDFHASVLMRDNEGIADSFYDSFQYKNTHTVLLTIDLCKDQDHLVTRRGVKI